MLTNLTLIYENLNNETIPGMAIYQWRSGQTSNFFVFQPIRFVHSEHLIWFTTDVVSLCNMVLVRLVLVEYQYKYHDAICLDFYCEGISRSI